MLLEKMTTELWRFKQNVRFAHIGQFCINFMRIVTRKTTAAPSIVDGADEDRDADKTPQWRYSVQYYLGDIYSGDYHDQSGVIVESNCLRAQAAVKRLIQDQHPSAASILITGFERINKRPKQRKLKRAQPTGPGYLYLLEGKPGEYKIGFSASPQRRIAVLGVQLPFTIEVIHLIEVDNMLSAERMLHEQFAMRRINGEWFALTTEDVTTIRSLTRIDAE
jgi:hypothetical protein